MVTIHIERVRDRVCTFAAPVALAHHQLILRLLEWKKEKDENNRRESGIGSNRDLPHSIQTPKVCWSRLFTSFLLQII